MSLKFDLRCLKNNKHIATITDNSTITQLSDYNVQFKKRETRELQIYYSCNVCLSNIKHNLDVKLNDVNLSIFHGLVNCASLSCTNPKAYIRTPSIGIHKNNNQYLCQEAYAKNRVIANNWIPSNEEIIDISSDSENENSELNSISIDFIDVSSNTKCKALEAEHRINISENTHLLELYQRRINLSAKNNALSVNYSCSNNITHTQVIHTINNPKFKQIFHGLISCDSLLECMNPTKTYQQNELMISLCNNAKILHRTSINYNLYFGKNTPCNHILQITPETKFPLPNLNVSQINDKGIVFNYRCNDAKKHETLVAKEHFPYFHGLISCTDINCNQDTNYIILDTNNQTSQLCDIAYNQQRINNRITYKNSST